MLRRWSIRWKLTFMALSTASVALLLAFAGVITFEYVMLRRHMKGELEMLAEMVGGNSNAAITFNRADDVAATLETLRAKQEIVAACIYDAQGKVMATYRASNSPQAEIAPTPAFEGLRFGHDSLEAYRPVILDGKAIGTVYLRSDLRELYDRVGMLAVITPAMLVAALGAGMLLANRLQRVVSRPIAALAETSRKISEEKDYSLRAPHFADDEIGRLAEAFNVMLEGIRQRDQEIQKHMEELQAAHGELENRVEQRTAELKRANVDLQEEMVRRQEAERRKEQMQASLVEASRKAGMADVATGVLHNVGNVLNSVNVSTQLVHDAVKESRVTMLVKAVDLMRQHSEDLGEFMTRDDRGRTLPILLGKIAETLTVEQSTMLKEIDGLSSNIAHIREIVAMQQSFSVVAGVKTRATIGELFEDALKINHAGLNRHQVTVKREYDAALALVTDRHKVLQILINLVSNAKYAVNGTQEQERVVRLTARECGKDMLELSVVDNGVGIEPQSMKKIFGFGFTTKKHGHGFGLHSSVLAAKELGGKLEVFSEGAGKGATFTLTLPRNLLQVQEATHAAEGQPAASNHCH